MKARKNATTRFRNRINSDPTVDVQDKATLDEYASKDLDWCRKQYELCRSDLNYHIKKGPEQ